MAEAIDELADMLRDVGERRGETWGACEQIELSGLYRRDGTPYAPRPDVMVLARPLEGFRAAVSLTEAGAPLFVCEVISASTARADREGKRTAYAAAGIPEYLIYDIAGDLLEQPFEGELTKERAARAYLEEQIRLLRERPGENNLSLARG